MTDTFKISSLSHSSFFLGTPLQKAEEWKMLREPFDPYWPGPFHFTDGTFGIRIPSPHGEENIRVQRIDAAGRMTVHDLIFSQGDPVNGWAIIIGNVISYCLCAMFVSSDGAEFSQSDIAPSTGVSNVPTEDLAFLTAVPFDPDADAPVQTRDGRDVRILAKGLNAPSFPIVAAITNEDGAQSVVFYHNDGTMALYPQSNLTLVNVVRAPRSTVLIAINGEGCHMFITHPSMREKNEADGYRVVEFAPVPK